MGGEKMSGIELIQTLDNRVKEVRTNSLDISFGELANKFKDGDLIIEPDFQRLFRWSEGQQSRFIESLLLELPIPPFFLIENDNGILELIDGLQRISSYLCFTGLHPRFKDSSLTLTDCDIIPELNGLTYKDLPLALQLGLKNRYVSLEIVKRGSDPRLRYYMFKRLNTGGEALSDQEVRNSTIRLLNDEFNKFIVKLSQNEDFKICISSLSEEKISQKYNEELVLRFFAFKNIRDKFKHDIADFMTGYMENVSDPTRKDVSFDYAKEELEFRNTFKILNETLGEYAFSRVNEKGNYVLGFIVYHYEAFTLGIQKYLEKINLDDESKIKEIKKVFDSIKRDPQFKGITTGGGKNTKGALDDRITFVERRLGDII